MSRWDDIPALADEYVLGLLDPAEEASVEARLSREPQLAAAIGSARDRFVELDLAAEPMAVPVGLWDRIVADLGSQPSAPAKESRTPEPIVAATAAEAANDNAASPWRGRALAAMAASVLLATGLGVSLTRTPEPVVVAVLVSATGEPQALVEDFGDASARVTPLVDFEVPQGRTMQVWTLPSADLGPVSLGLLGAARSALLDGPELPRPKADQLYEITLEQEGGSPTGRPTGPILVKGFAKIPR